MQAQMQQAQMRAATVTLPSHRQILITRAFAAPRHLVFRAFTTPELVRRWWSADMGEVTVADIDLRVGGRWRYVMLTHEGHEVAFHGEYREIVPGERLVCTEVFEGMPQGEALNTATFSEQGDHTLLSLLVQHSSQEHRDAHLNSGMEVGMQKTLNFLEDVARSLA